MYTSKDSSNLSLINILNPIPTPSLPTSLLYDIPSSSATPPTQPLNLAAIPIIPQPDPDPQPELEFIPAPPAPSPAPLPEPIQ